MFKLVLVAVLLGLAAAADSDQDAQVLNLKNIPSDAEGNFNYAFETSNGINAQEAGNLEGVSGSAQWVSPEGVAINLQYTADENGYHPAGEHLPVSPPIPEQIVRAIEYINAHPPREELVLSQPH